MNPQNQPYRSDLAGFAALLGESFRSRIDLLERVIERAHYPSLGRYKERLLAQLIRDYIPTRYEVGTGFVLFPHEDFSPPGGLENHDPLNKSAFTVSRQCDILVVDSSTVPPVFRDGDFLVVRPEAVIAVVEVKGSLTGRGTSSILKSFSDFGQKWRNTQLFYKDHNQPLTPVPGLFAMAWSIKKCKGKPETNPTKERERIAEYYRKTLDITKLNGLPLLDKLYIYNECEIGRSGWVEDWDAEELRVWDGWASSDGRFIRFANQTPFRDSDRTIASLLAAIHWHVNSGESFNRFFSYMEETRDPNLVPYDHTGFSVWHKPVGDETSPRRTRYV